MANAPTIAVVAAGSMGGAVGARLASRGVRVLTSLEGRSEATQRRAREAGFEVVDAEALAGADIVLSIVPPDQALPLAGWFGARFREARAAPLYVDLNAVNPATARAIGAALATSRARYVDGGIIGGPPGAQGAGPTFYVAGPDAGEAEALTQYGLVIKRLAGPIGAASALKMCYAGLTKGVTALGAAMILAAQREGAADALAREWASSQGEMLARLSKSVPDMLPKAYRWVPEMNEIAGFLGPDDPASGIYDAIAKLYQSIEADPELGRRLQGFFPQP